MKIIYCIKYFGLDLIALLVWFPVIDDSFYLRTRNYFMKLGDVSRAFKIYLANNGINEKPYFLKNGYELKAQFKMQVIAMTDEDLQSTYPLERK